MALIRRRKDTLSREATKPESLLKAVRTRTLAASTASIHDIHDAVLVLLRGLLLLPSVSDSVAVSGSRSFPSGRLLLFQLSSSRARFALISATPRRALFIAASPPPFSHTHLRNPPPLHFHFPLSPSSSFIGLFPQQCSLGFPFLTLSL